MITVKVGGSIVDGLHHSFISDITELASQGLVLVHGGGREVTQVCKDMGVQPRFVTSPGGIRSRYTDKKTSDIFTMVMAGRIGPGIVQMLQRHDMPAVNLTGLDAGVLRARRKERLVIINERGRRQFIDGGYTGTISSVNHRFLQDLVNCGITPVVSPVAMGEEFESLNVDGDRAAAQVAAATGSDAVIFVTDVDGLMMDDSLVDSMSLDEAQNMLPKIGHGMQKKILAATEALRGGVNKAIICTGSRESPLKRALAGDNCTVVRS